MKSLTERINESLIGFTLSAAGLVLGLVQMVNASKQANHNDTTVKDAISKLKEDKKLVYICKRLKDDDDVKSFLKQGGSSAGWKDLIASKLSNDEVRYINMITKSKVSDLDRYAKNFFDEYLF